MPVISRFLVDLCVCRAPVATFCLPQNAFFDQVLNVHSSPLLIASGVFKDQHRNHSAARWIRGQTNHGKVGEAGEGFSLHGVARKKQTTYVTDDSGFVIGSNGTT